MEARRILAQSVVQDYPRPIEASAKRTTFADSSCARLIFDRELQSDIAHDADDWDPTVEGTNPAVHRCPIPSPPQASRPGHSSILTGRPSSTRIVLRLPSLPHPLTVPCHIPTATFKLTFAAVDPDAPKTRLFTPNTIATKRELDVALESYHVALFPVCRPLGRDEVGVVYCSASTLLQPHEPRAKLKTRTETHLERRTPQGPPLAVGGTWLGQDRHSPGYEELSFGGGIEE
ncbi:hypothetical protein NMY22_g15673 [Coprinellus aureogranulatus]|nr:hypothetical protein NMY22_g15673 [Coprinellus aureogranulatus]